MEMVVCDISKKDILLVSYAYKNGGLINALKSRGSLIKSASLTSCNYLQGKLLKLDEQID